MDNVYMVMFYKHKWTTNEARQWLKDNGYNRIKRVKKTKVLLKYTINEPREFKSFTTDNLGEETGIIIINGIR